MTSPFYSAAEVLDCYRSLGVQKGDVVYVTGNFGRLGAVKSLSKQALLALHLELLQELVGSDGTLVVPTHSFSLCNTDKPFSVRDTASETGPFSEFVRQSKGAVRQYHAFSSSCALGKSARFLCENNSRHVYGLHSPFARMLELDAKFVSVGMEARTNVSLVHHAEFMMGVPYRYTKEFVHPVQKENEITNELFYLHVIYRDMDVTRNRNKNIFEFFEQKYSLKRQALGLSQVQCFNMKEFLDSTSELLSKNVYAWLDQPPEKRPFRC